MVVVLSVVAAAVRGPARRQRMRPQPGLSTFLIERVFFRRRFFEDCDHAVEVARCGGLGEGTALCHLLPEHRADGFT